MTVPPLKYMFKNGRLEIEKVALMLILLTQTYLIKQKVRLVQKKLQSTVCIL